MNKRKKSFNIHILRCLSFAHHVVKFSRTLQSVHFVLLYPANKARVINSSERVWLKTGVKNIFEFFHGYIYHEKHIWH